MGATTADDLRTAIGHFATGVAVIASRTADGDPVGTTANAVASLSLDPPLVLVCFDRDSQTLAAVRAHGAFAINVLAAHHREVSAAFARPGAGEVWEALEHRHGASGSPHLHDALATLDCAVHEILPGGDHEIVLGRVLEAAPGAQAHEPLLYYRGAYASLAAA